MKFLKTMCTLCWTGASLLLIYFFWTGVLPDRMEGSASPDGIELKLKMTGTRGWAVDYKTSLILTIPEGEGFIYNLEAMGSLDAVHKLVGSMVWENGTTLSFEHQPKKKHVIISYDDGLWSLSEDHL